MELHQLRYFVGVAEEGGFCRAAAVLGISQPSLSQQVRRLERGLGQELFDRLGRRTVLTDAGRALLPRARRVLDELAAIQSPTPADTGAPPRLLVGAIPTVAPFVFPAAVRELLRSHPPCDFVAREDVTDRLAAALLDAEIDLAILGSHLADARIETETVAAEPLALAVPVKHPWAGRASLPLHALDEQPLIVLHEEHCFGRHLAALCTGARVSPAAHSATASLHTALALVAQGVGITVVPALCAASVRGSGCAFVPIAGDTSRELVIAWRRGRTRSAAANAFAEASARAIREQLGRWRAKQRRR